MIVEPQMQALMVKAGVNPLQIAQAGQSTEPDAIRTLRILASDPNLMAAEIARRQAGATQINTGDKFGAIPPGMMLTKTPSGPQLKDIPGRPPTEGETKERERQRDLSSALRLYETAREGLLAGLGETKTGPLIGKMPAITSAQQTAQGSVAAMAPILKQLFRVAGEGVFTDRDQQLLIDMIPTRETNPEARKAMIENIDAIVRAKLGLSGAKSENAIDFGDLPD
jgi:hypothetical protein